MMALAVAEEKTPDDSLPDPSELGFSASEAEWVYVLWTQWRALGKPPQVSTLMKEIADGYGGVIAGLLEMESLFNKAKLQIENKKPRGKHAQQ